MLEFAALIFIIITAPIWLPIAMIVGAAALALGLLGLLLIGISQEPELTAGILCALAVMYLLAWAIDTALTRITGMTASERRAAAVQREADRRKRARERGERLARWIKGKRGETPDPWSDQ